MIWLLFLQEADPFWEPPDTEVTVGIALIPLNYLAHMVEMEDHITVLNYWAQTVGYVILKYSKPGLNDH